MKKLIFKIIAFLSRITKKWKLRNSASTTNASLVIAPNGSGALIADIPDGLVSGGNARGAYAVDLQSLRTGANQVASGNWSFAQGQKNNEVVQDLIMNNHDFCINCGEIYYVSTPTKKFCSKACRSRFNYIIKKK
jgi:hypothetical protein